MRKNLLVTVMLLLATVGGLLAQGVTTASISGLVSDKDSKPLSGANVVAVHVPSGTKYGVATRTDGRYKLPAVRIGGPYTITVSFVGYDD